ncbi:hypothetical protein [Pseudoduganella violacea]|uniref:Uncharacterized protein n=1 Tax=Pseudoduganella violacea TaxID=1715466 RepID=A0A7W5B5K2_9BURK|nr:hypothetical protein [Pseudoduganella violacea]MBB3116997.1 hypothetical protein [Pseudoduganella violacea]
MNIAKHMEAIFIVAAVLGGASAMATAAVPASAKANAPVVAKAPAGDMQVVTITAKRLSAAEKAAL